MVAITRGECSAPCANEYSWAKNAESVSATRVQRGVSCLDVDISWTNGDLDHASRVVTSEMRLSNTAADLKTSLEAAASITAAVSSAYFSFLEVSPISANTFLLPPFYYFSTMGVS